MSNSHVASSTTGQGMNTFQRECKAAYLMVKNDTTDDLMSVDEFVQAMQHAGRNPTRKTIKRYWTVDQGRMEFRKFCDILKEVPESTDEELKKAFKKIDINKNGYITIEELKVLRQTDENLTDEDIRNIFKGADKDNDGKIDYIEFANMVQQTAKETKQMALSRLERLERRRLKTKKNQRRDRNKEQQNSTEKILPQPNDSLFKAPANSAKRVNEPNNIEYWKKIKRKGCFIYDDDPEFPTLLCHRFKLSIEKTCNVFLKMSHYTNDKQSSLSSDTMLFLLDSRGKVIGFTSEKTKDNLYCYQGNLQSGDYYLLPFTTSCKFKPIKLDESKKQTTLLETGKDGNLKLTKPFRLALMNIFDMCDLDDNGALNREEFNIYNVRTGDEHVTDDEWKIVKSNFDSKNEELTMKGFVDLHQMEAEDSGGDTYDMWVSLLAMGFNHALQMEQALPFAIELWYDGESENKIEAKEIQSISTDIANEITNYFFNNSSPLDSDQNVLRCYHNDFLAVILIENREAIRKNGALSIDECENVVFSCGAQKRINLSLEPNRTKIICYALPINEDAKWKIRLSLVENQQ